jgi:hypothetical protein
MLSAVFFLQPDLRLQRRQGLCRRAEINSQFSFYPDDVHCRVKAFKDQKLGIHYASGKQSGKIRRAFIYMHGVHIGRMYTG